MALCHSLVVVDHLLYYLQGPHHHHSRLFVFQVYPPSPATLLLIPPTGFPFVPRLLLDIFDLCLRSLLGFLPHLP
jgi:hypothetical protein